MNLLSLLIAPLQAVVLFFAPHAVGTKPLGFRNYPVNTTDDLSVKIIANPSVELIDHPPTTAAAQLNGQLVAQTPVTVRVAPTSLLAAPSRITYPLASRHPAKKPIHCVRVVRNLDATLAPDRAGRMVVSGRFADVCAELDRMAASSLRMA